MFKKLTYKKKNRLLAAGALVFIMLAYLLAFKKTIVLYSQCSDLKQQMQLASDAPQKAVLLEKQLKDIENLLGDQSSTGVDNQQLLLELITNYCEKENITLREFPKPLITSEKDYSIETNIFVVEGNFIKLLNLIYVLEQKRKVGKVASVHFQSKKNYKTKRLALTATIYLQNIVKTKL